MEDERSEPVEPEGAEDIPGGSAPGGAQTDPATQEGGGAANLGEAQAEDPAIDEDDPMLTEPPDDSEGDQPPS